MATADKVAPPPQGFVLDSNGSAGSTPPPPDGFKLDGQGSPSHLHRWTVNGVPGSPSQEPSPDLSPSENAAAVENTISQRPSSFGTEDSKPNFSSLGQGALSVLRMIATPFQIAEAVPADIGLAAQRAQIGGFQQLPGNLIKDVTGKRVPQVGDVYRGSGIPGLSSEPVASTLGLIASIGVPGVNKGTNLVGEAIGKALSPATDMISSAAARYGKPMVSQALSVVTSKPEHIWESLIENPQWSDKKFVEGMNQTAEKAYQKVVKPLESNTANRIVLDDGFKSQLHDIEVYVKPKGVDESTFSKAISGDENAVNAVANEKRLDRLEELAKRSDLSAAERNRQLRELIGTEEATVSGRPGARGLNIGSLGAKPEDILEPSSGLGRMSQGQQAQIKNWYRELVSKPDLSFNEARRIQSQINTSMQSYYDMIQAKGSGITGAQATTFGAYASKIKSALVGAIGNQYPEAGQVLKAYSTAKNAENVYRTVSTFEPHMFRAFLLRMGLTMSGVPGGLAYGMGAMGSIPKVNAKLIGGTAANTASLSRIPGAKAALLLKGLTTGAASASQTQ